ncbi:sensor histidine kinase [Pollutibacter soli]|uniref:sensor histidine kinase n=1 Tax=Pollutibacter soli TaxID=3034157 RepID=UPI003013AB55
MKKNRSAIEWVIKYKIYHLPFWFIYHVLWWTITIGSLTMVFNNIFHSAYVYKFLFYVIFEALGAYFVLYYLLPHFLEKGKIKSFIILFAVTALLTGSLIVLGYPFSSWVSGTSMFELYGKQPHEYMYFFKTNTMASATAALTLALSVKLTKNWIQSKNRQQILEKEKLESELRFLKTQFNPHFLFNSINSIFVLIHKNPDMASESLAKFSDLLRYQLYDCNESWISLKQEMNYIENFIGLEKLRQEKNVELNINVNFSCGDDVRIAPFILMPFIENAFKHVSKFNDRKNEINIQIGISESCLFLETSNSVSEHHRLPGESSKYKGLGLKNIRRRLELLYDKKHQLDIFETNEKYSVKLMIVLEREAQQINRIIETTPSYSYSL